MFRRRPVSIILPSLALALMLSTSQPSFAADWGAAAAEEGAGKAFDILVFRPLGTLRVIVGAAMMLPAVVFAAPSGEIKTVYEILLEEPIEYAFERELGDF